MTAMPNPYDPLDAVVQALREVGCHVQSAGRDSYAAQCPAHDDRDPSLSVTRGTKGEPKALVYCHAGCGVNDILDAIGMGSRQLFADYDPAKPGTVTHLHHLRAWRTPEERQQRPKPRPWTRDKVCHYDYVWPDGTPAIRVVRYNKIDKETGEVVGKTFTQHAWDTERGRYAETLGDTDPPLYHADLVANAIAAGLPVVVCEGEKDADNVAATFNLTATTNPMGAEAWRPQHTDALRGANVLILADDDQAGLQHVQAVSDALQGVAASVTVRLPAEGFKDISDQIEAGLGIDALRSPDPEPERTTWWPVDIGAILSGDGDGQPEPTHLTRDDGANIFYPGRVNGVIGESESGKTWVALLGVKQALQVGQKVLYLDFEDTAAGIVARLKAMNVGLHNLTTFAYVSPDEQLHTDAAADFKAVIGAGYDLVVVDGFNAAMTLLGLDINSNNDATTFVQTILKPIAATGSTVVYIDHVPKNKDARGKGGIGAQAKRAMTTGCAITVEVAQPFGEGQRGKLHLKVDKDRPGKVRAVSAESTFAGTVTIDSVGDVVDISFSAPNANPDGFRPTRVMERISRLLEEAGDPVTQNSIESQVTGGSTTIRRALEHLLRDGHITVAVGPNRANLYTLKSAFRDDEQSDL